MSRYSLPPMGYIAHLMRRKEHIPALTPLLDLAPCPALPPSVLAPPQDISTDGECKCSRAL